MTALDLVATWPVRNATAGYVVAGGTPATTGDADRPFPLASVTKLLTTLAVLVAVEEGSVELDEPPLLPPGPDLPGATVRHLLAHASGLPFFGRDRVASPGARRVYSNTGIELAAAHVEARTGIPFPTYLAEAVVEPLHLDADLGDRSPAAGAVAPLRGVLALGAELLAPTVIAPSTLAEATTVQYPGLAGIVPGIGRMDPCDWGLGFELKGTKAPHWTGTNNSAATFGHFGGDGTFLWVDPVAGVACAALTDRTFGDWALAAWPVFADQVLAEG